MKARAKVGTSGCNWQISFPLRILQLFKSPPKEGYLLNEADVPLITALV